MLNSITFKQDFRCFKANDKFAFKPGVNLLVGDQGTGKSTLLHLFTSGKKKYSDVISVDANPIPYYAFDFEKDNPRKKARIETGSQIASLWVSHGQSNFAVLKILEKPGELKEPSLLLMDEADMALSIRSCYKLVEMLKRLEVSKHQIIAIVHNPIVIQAFDIVLSIEHKQWITPKEFIISHSPK